MTGDGEGNTPGIKVPSSLWISNPPLSFVVSVTCRSRYQHRHVLPATPDRSRTAMIIPLDIAVALTAAAVFFAFVVALAAD
jgi:hypothetical protein